VPDGGDLGLLDEIEVEAVRSLLEQTELDGGAESVAEDPVDDGAGRRVVQIEIERGGEEARHARRAHTRSHGGPGVACVLQPRLVGLDDHVGGDVRPHPAQEVALDEHRCHGADEVVHGHLEESPPLLERAAAGRPLARHLRHLVEQRVAQRHQAQRFQRVLPLRAADQLAEQA